jgi:hypothetical protein
MRRWAWSRLVVVSVLFALGVAAALVDWHRHPPAPQLDGGSINMRNVPGDLAAVLCLYAIEFIVAGAAFQPWLPRPRRRVLGSIGLLFGVWGVLRWLVGTHSPPVMFAHDILMLIVALVLCGATLAYSPDERPVDINPPVT